MTLGSNYPLTAQVNSEGHLEVGGCDTTLLAREFGTPLYVIDQETLISSCQSYQKSFAKYFDNFLILYANKALSLSPILKLIKDQGLGMDVASAGELFTALKAEVDPALIYLHGNGKTKEELAYALNEGIGRIVVDSFSELKKLEQIAKEKGKVARILFRITPEIEAHTHEYIQTGRRSSKFGILREEVLTVIQYAINSASIEFMGIHDHIGSQIFGIEAFVETVKVMLNLIDKIQNDLNVAVRELNLGGGWGISYLQEDQAAPVECLAKALKEEIGERFSGKIMLEPGRSIVGRAGITLYEVQAIKTIQDINKKYLMLDGGMADNIRPMLYQAQYDAVAANKMKEKSVEQVDLAGRFCESGDVLIKDIMLPTLAAEDLIAVLATGAYNYSMASNYNRVLRPAMVLVDKGKARLILRRETFEDLVRNEVC